MNVLQERLRLPVQSVAHLNGDEHRQGHGHGVGRLEHLAVQTVKLWVVGATLEEVALWGGRQEGEGGERAGGTEVQLLRQGDSPAGRE